MELIKEETSICRFCVNLTNQIRTREIELVLNVSPAQTKSIFSLHSFQARSTLNAVRHFDCTQFKKKKKLYQMKIVIRPHFLCHLSSTVLIYRRRVSQLAPQVNLTSLACSDAVYVCV